MRSSRAEAARQEELYRSNRMLVNQVGDEFRAARGDDLLFRAVGAAVRRMLELREIHAGNVDRAGAEDLDARGIDFIVPRGSDEQRRAIDLRKVLFQLSRKPA